ncbi:nitroreductase/quinone reductase family protein [Microbacterium sp. M3]|uniref:Nitroreductase/quinone reductase family protein n=1 Tax=Microbacterium arthrosphaerae TaxID=792652 RepID=A0ABU4GXL1_9MICO|nr:MULTISPECIES: nitroreductase/quinone reductase family protein [Microbacterium]MDW4571812.1 nitroreductase/quinone reductase family protein [Microbacterium arthrosphaerae]MDW7605667.1 nitroreductase/quinone reductase family protein [Microbacterium sp. M3]
MNTAPSSPSETPATQASSRIPPRWFIRTAWVFHRALYRVTGGRVGLRHPSSAVYGMMRLHTVGRRSGAPRVAIVAYVEDGENLVTLAMNGWGDPPPAWWLNLRARPAASVDLPEGSREVVAREATGAERERLWAVWRTLEGGADLDAHAARRTRQTPVVVLAPA